MSNHISKINKKSNLSWCKTLLLGTTALLFNACTTDYDSTIANQQQAEMKIEQLQKKVVNGSLENENGLRSTVALMEKGGSYFCTGTLIHPRVVLTAAHCLENTQANQIEVGQQTLSGFEVGANKRLAVDHVINHEDYGWNGSSEHTSGVGTVNDIALLILSEAGDQAVSPVLPSAQTSSVLSNGTMLTISGYGINNLETQNDGVLYTGEVPVVYVGSTEILAGERGNTTDTCNGDSGGPAYVQANGQSYVVGVTSRAADTSQINCGDQGIYTLASSYTQWIEDKMNQFDLESDGGDGNNGDGDNGDGDNGDGDGDGDNGDNGDNGGNQEDICEINAWYNDGICDDMCAQPDPDCEDNHQEIEEDICEINAWYNDGICDEMCAQPDPDCEDNHQGFEDDICEAYGWYDDGICDEFCAQPDPDCL